MARKFEITTEQTPNPETLKFVFQNLTLNLPKQGDDGVADFFQFNNSMEAEISPLASKLFGFPWTQAVMIAPAFVAITKQDWVDWSILADPLKGLIAEHIEQELPIIEVLESSDLSELDEDDASDSDLVKAIKRTIRSEIRPVVALDGGDVLFAKYESGKLYLHMRGACAGCPSKSVTLKEGIETRIRSLYPEVQEVLAL